VYYFALFLVQILLPELKLHNPPYIIVNKYKLLIFILQKVCQQLGVPDEFVYYFALFLVQILQPPELKTSKLTSHYYE
jgi:hypothetical protein